jgi:hypothetical protein
MSINLKYPFVVPLDGAPDRCLAFAPDSPRAKKPPVKGGFKK